MCPFLSLSLSVFVAILLARVSTLFSVDRFLATSTMESQWLEENQIAYQPCHTQIYDYNPHTSKYVYMHRPFKTGAEIWLSAKNGVVIHSTRHYGHIIKSYPRHSNIAA